MVIVLMIATVVLAISIDAYVQHHRKRTLAESTNVPELPGMPAELRATVLDELARSRKEPAVLLHPGHSWARRGTSRVVTVGADELTGRLLGSAESVSLPSVGDRVVQGRTAWHLSRKGRDVAQVAPVTGVVQAVNKDAIAHPDAVNRDPYGEGWLLKIDPSRWDRDRDNLFSGSLVREWLALSKSRVLAIFGSEGVAGGYATAQDGGELVDGLSERITDEQWQRLNKELFLRNSGTPRI